MVLILFKMEKFTKEGAVYRPKILYGIKSPSKNRAEDNYADSEDQVNYDTE